MLTIVGRSLIPSSLYLSRILELPKTSALIAIFALRVREERKMRGYSQEHLADLAGLHRTYIGMIERREKNVSLKNVEKIARALKMEPSRLLRLN
jgi:DNA-binding XRE family transcriptional regulator